MRSGCDWPFLDDAQMRCAHGQRQWIQLLEERAQLGDDLGFGLVRPHSAHAILGHFASGGQDVVDRTALQSATTAIHATNVRHEATSFGLLSVFRWRRLS